MKELKELGIGSRIRHPRYGIGIIARQKLQSADVFFKEWGDREIPHTEVGIEVKEEAPVPDDRLTLDEVQGALEGVLRKVSGITEIIEMGDRWQRGTMILQPANKELKPKEIPIETFFHKIVMTRDRLRVLEQNINSNTKLTDEEKVHIQQYITRAYGSLTTFNVLFKDKDDYFTSKAQD